MEHENGKPSLNPSSLTVANAARLLTKASGQPVTAEMLEIDLGAGAPANSDGSINLVHYTAWLVRELGNRD